MGFGYTPNLNLAKPEYGEQGVNWWRKINENFDKLDRVGPLGGGAYTAGSIIFAGAGGVLGQDNANLCWDNAGKELRIHNTALRKGVYGAHLAFRTTQPDYFTWVYVCPNGDASGADPVPSLNLRSAIKIFSTDYEADPANYDVGFFGY